ncbi:hypothetical protein PVK06_042155 [Gossypium arboreum]|uniref:Uncharacterized protein n=1 Tax=Gossypium arboreum TaxID=29729 RepID=A0ABR0MKJ4_GOSAR|nr:hypothetical protein PVK06_042155 [Gossypium arboreum]
MLLSSVGECSFVRSQKNLHSSFHFGFDLSVDDVKCGSRGRGEPIPPPLAASETYEESQVSMLKQRVRYESEAEACFFGLCILLCVPPWMTISMAF